jgi:hypothetical protein
MNPILAFVIGVAAACGLSLAVVIVLRKPLLRILIELCGGEPRAAFWLVFYEATAVVGTLFTALTFGPKPSAGTGGIEIFGLGLDTLRAGLIGLLGALLILGFVMLSSIRTFESRSRVPASAPPQASPGPQML